MRAFIPKQAPSRTANSAPPAKRENITPRNERGFGRDGSAPAGLPQSFDFGRIPLYHPAAGKLQTKLTGNGPEDAYGQEADPVVRRVMRMPERQHGGRCACGGGCPKCQNVHDMMGKQAALPQTGSEHTAPNPRLIAPTAAQPASGELMTAALDESKGGLAITGDGGTPGGTLPYREATNLLECMRIMGDEAYCRQEVLGEATAVPQPILQKTTVSGPTTSNNGGFSWGSRWSLQNATASTNGWIVQHVTVTQNVTDAAGAAVVPGQGTFGGLSTAWYPLWEAWQVRGGQVFVGGSATAHNADTYGQNPVGANTQGTTAVVGRANFYPNLTLPTGFTVKNAAPAWALPATNTDPNLIGGTGPLSHSLTATWNGVTGNGVTTVTTV
ncbi:MAG TPA: hypothetical protein VN838_23955 [Bradyrhizobium sp.]|nr:hypothetical protein [Bradyrhizobium sp.]